MGKRACTISLLSGVLAIVVLGSLVGSVAGYALSGAVMGLFSALSKSVSYARNSAAGHKPPPTWIK
jgi:hypothetical protein